MATKKKAAVRKDNEPPFFKQPGENGVMEWTESRRVWGIKAKLLHIMPSSNEEVRGASFKIYDAIKLANGENPPRPSSRKFSGTLAAYVVPHPVSEHTAQSAYRDIIMPIAKRMATMKRPKTKEQVEAMKKAALAFLSDAIDHAFPVQMLPKSMEIESATLIEVSLNLCKKWDRLPSKKEVRNHSPYSDMKIEKLTWKRRFDAAGLQGLPQGIKSGK